MVYFIRMKDDMEGGLTSQITSKLPGKSINWLIILVVVFIILLIGFGIGFGSGRSSGGQGGCVGDSCKQMYYVSPTNESCPPLEAEMLLTTLPQGNSFEGLSVDLQCSGNYIPYPRQVKCERRYYGAESHLMWTALPVCYPPVLLTPGHWAISPLVRSVSCKGDRQHTECSLQCIQNYIAVEKNKYTCHNSPCRAWTLEGKQCYRCNKNCDQFGKVHEPLHSDLLSMLTCDPDCDQIVVTSDGPAAVWQNKRTGLFNFIGEHGGRPMYQNNATKEFLYYTQNGAEWLVGPDYTKQHAGIQVFLNDDKSCPERHGGENQTKLYIDSSKPVQRGGTMWNPDPTISFECYKPRMTQVTQCSCTTYKVYNTMYTEDEVPEQVTQFSGSFQKVVNPDDKFGLITPLYYNQEKDLYLFSHHIGGKVWQISQNLTTSPIRGVFSSTPSCPDTEDISWEWYNTTTPLKQQLYVSDEHIKVKCISGHHGA